MRIIAVPDGDTPPVDVTDAVRILWDLYQSIMAGSGFLSTDEAVAFDALRDAAGFREA